MALNIPGQSQVDVSVAQTVQANARLRVKSALFDFDMTQAIISIVYVTPEGEILKQEMWMLSGEYYNAKVLEPTEGKSIAEELLGKIAATVIDIQTDPGKKEELLANGCLSIV